MMEPDQKPTVTGPAAGSESAPKHHRPARREGLKVVISTIVILLIAPVLALIIIAFVFQSYVVDGPSMENTLQTNNRLIIWKVGRTWSRITGEDYIPRRGSVAVFVKRGLYDFSSDREKQLIKRVIGVPGDRVVVADGKVTVYNGEHTEGFNPDETLGYGNDLKGETTGNVDITVGAGELFFMGDHRDNSLDSRTFGVVPAQDVVGTMTLRILPLSEIEKF